MNWLIYQSFSDHGIRVLLKESHNGPGVNGHTCCNDGILHFTEVTSRFMNIPKTKCLQVKCYEYIADHVLPAQNFE